MAPPSSAVKYAQGPGCTGVGGAPAFADQGKLPFTSNAEAEVVENMSEIAVVKSSSRRLTPGLERDLVLIPSSCTTTVLLAGFRGFPMAI
jgi:hypothetical protein